MMATEVPCPAWCESCTPEAEGGFGHLGRDQEIELTLVAPRTGEHPFYGRPFWSAEKLRVCLAQRHGAALPVINLRDDNHISSEISIDLAEAAELQQVLGILIEQGTSALYAATEAEGTSGT